MNNIDPYNNAPAGKCGKGGTCGKGGNAPPQQVQTPFSSNNFNENFGNNYLSNKQSSISENQMLRSDLQAAINYIYSLGGKWPPPTPYN